MGNWRRVWIKGSIPKSDVDILHKFLSKNSSYPLGSEFKGQQTIYWSEEVEFEDGGIVVNNESMHEMKMPISFYYFETSSWCEGGINKMDRNVIKTWISTTIDVVGNIGKGASNKDIMLEFSLIAASFPKISLTILVGGDYESDTCVAQVIVKDGRAFWNPPCVEKMPEL